MQVRHGLVRRRPVHGAQAPPCWVPSAAARACLAVAGVPTPAVQAIVDTLAPTIQPVVDAVAPAVEPVLDAIAFVVEAGCAAFVAEVFLVLGTTVQSLVDAITPVVEPLIDAIAPVIQAILDAVAEIRREVGRVILRLGDQGRAHQQGHRQERDLAHFILQVIR